MTDDRRSGKGRGPTSRTALAVMLLLVVGLGSGCVTIQASEGGFAMGGRIHVAEGEVAREEIVLFGGSVVVDGEARRDVVVIGGSLEINGTAADVVNIGGAMRVGPDARIRGDLVNVGGRLDRSPGAEIEGEVVNVGFAGFRGVPWGDFGWTWGHWWGISPFRVVTRTTQLVYWLLLAVLAVALAGDRISSASHAVAREPLRVGVIGLVGFFSLILLTVVFVLLSVVLIGIPFLIAILLGWWLAYIFGMVSVFQLVGQKLAAALGKRDASQLGLVLGGGLVLCVFHYFPWVGTLVWWVAAFLGLGTVFATRFGTNQPWLTRRVETVPPTPQGPPAQAPPGDPYRPSSEAQPDEPFREESPTESRPDAGPVERDDGDEEGSPRG